MTLAAAIGGDFIKENTTTVGTATYVLAGAVTNYQTFLSWFGSGTSRLPYVAVDGAGGFEIGIGSYVSGSNSISRDYIFWSSNAGAAVSWPAGNRQIYCAQSSGGSSLTGVGHACNQGANPSVGDDASMGYDAMSLWLHQNTGELWMCVDATIGAASWRRIVKCPSGSAPSSATSEVIGGASNTASGSNQVILGGQNNAAAAGANGAVAKGTYASAQHPNADVLGGGAAAGRQQAEKIVLSVQTVSSGATRLQLSNGSSDHLVLPTDGIWKVKASVCGWRTSDQKAATWELASLWYRSASGNPTQIGSTTGTTPDFYNTSLSSTWTAVFAADNTNKAIDINVTADSSTAVNWEATVRIEQVTN